MSCMFVMQVIVDKLRMEGNVGVEVGNVREVFLYVCWGGHLECGVNGQLSYMGGSSDCVWVTEDMRYEDVVRAVEGTIQEGLQGRRL